MTQLLPRAPRHKVSIRATMRAGGPKVAISVRDISMRGMLIEAAELPDRGSYVEIIGPSNSVTGRVIWARDGRFALRTRERLDVSAAPAGQAPLKLAEPATQMSMAKGSVDSSHLADRSRQLSSHVQFALLALCGLGSAAGIGFLAYSNLSRVLTAIVAVDPRPN